MLCCCLPQVNEYAAMTELVSGAVKEVAVTAATGSIKCFIRQHRADMANRSLPLPCCADHQAGLC